MKASAFGAISKLLRVGIPRPPKEGSLAFSSILAFASATATPFAGVRFARVAGLNAQLAGAIQLHGVCFAGVPHNKEMDLTAAARPQLIS